MSFIQTSVPLVFWGRSPPAHEVTCICRTEEKRGVATGSLSGQVCLWDICKERDTEKVKVLQLFIASIYVSVSSVCCWVAASLTVCFVLCYQFRPRCLLFGGSSSIIDICFVKSWIGERNRVATLSSKG